MRLTMRAVEDNFFVGKKPGKFSLALAVVSILVSSILLALTFWSVVSSATGPESVAGKRARVISWIEMMKSEAGISDAFVRAYLSTGDNLFLKRYQSSHERLNRELKELQSSLQGDPLVVQPLSELTNAIQTETEDFERSIEQKQGETLTKDGLHDALAILEADSERIKAPLDQIKALKRNAPTGIRAHVSEFLGPLLFGLVIIGCIAMAHFCLATYLRKRHQAELDRIAAIIGSSGDAILAATVEGTIVSWNNAAERLYGYTSEEVLGNSIEMLLIDDDPDEGANLLQRITVPGDFRKLETRRRCKDGSEIDIDLTISPISDSKDRIVGGSEVARDITARKKAEEALRQAHDKLETRVEERTEELAHAKEVAEAANASKSAFLSRMSHELRTPLNGILGFGQLLEMNIREGNNAQYVQQILMGGTHLLGLVNEVLDITSIECGTSSIDCALISVAESIEQAVQAISPSAAERHLRMKVELTEKTQLAFADKERLQQVLLKLLSNAVKYNRDLGSITVRVSSGPSMALPGTAVVRIEVCDTGEGVSEKFRDRLFIPFDRLGAERRGIEGTGLGLALCKRMVEMMGGAIGFDSIPSEGSTAWIELRTESTPISRSGTVAFMAEKAAVGFDFSTRWPVGISGAEATSTASDSVMI